MNKILPILLPKYLARTKNSFINRLAPLSTTNINRAIPPLIWLIAKPITKLGAIIAGRGFRKWWTSLPKIKRKIFLTHLIRNRVRYGSGVGLTTFTGFVFYDSHIQETPLTGRKRFILFTNEQLTEIEKLEQQQLLAIYESDILDPYSPHVNRAMRVANRLFSANREIPEVDNINWKLTVIDANIINAVAFPVALSKQTVFLQYKFVFFLIER